VLWSDVKSRYNRITLKIKDPKVQREFMEHTLRDRHKRLLLYLIYILGWCIIGVSTTDYSSPFMEQPFFMTLIKAATCIIFYALAFRYKKAVIWHGCLQMFIVVYQFATFRIDYEGPIMETLESYHRLFNLNYTFCFEYLLIFAFDFIYSYIFGTLIMTAAYVLFSIYGSSGNMTVLVVHAFTGILCTILAGYLVNSVEVKLFVKDQIQKKHQEDLETAFNSLPSGILILKNDKHIFSNKFVLDLLNFDSTKTEKNAEYVKILESKLFINYSSN